MLSAMAAARGIALTIHAADADEAVAILRAVSRVRGGADEELLVGPNGPAPTGHSYRELAEARRRGELDAVVTPQGLLLTQGALDAYRRRRTERRARPRGSPVVPIPAATDVDAVRAQTLEARGIPVRRRG